MKYGLWDPAEPDVGAVNALVSGGYGPLTAMVLAARGIRNSKEAAQYLDCGGALPDPFLLADMDKAAARVQLALDRGERIAVFGDYDVDGITATCLLTDFLKSRGADCVSYIPGRLEEGYGLNPIALRQLSEQGVKLIITVDCGITAVEETEYAKRLGMELVITDHHECKERLPDAVAVVDPHRPDGSQEEISGVGVAFKLAAALDGSQNRILSQYADMVCLGTVADVMPLVGENRVFVSRGLEALRNTRRPGLAALMEKCGCDRKSLSASSIGYNLAPRINAAGRMGEIEPALELFLTDSPQRGEAAAEELCRLNHLRQEIEQEIYRQAIAMLEGTPAPDAIVLASEDWHQGVVGIVASRIAEEYACPTFLICLDGNRGKASSRSHGGFNLFSSLTALSPLLESYGGHELAAGFTIARENIPEFRHQISQMAKAFFRRDTPRTCLKIDCAVPLELLTVPNIDDLELLEPCGSGCPKPILMTKSLTVERITLVGGGRHMRLRLSAGRHGAGGIYFSMTPEEAAIAVGDRVDVAYVPQVNEYRGDRTPQMNLVDIRPNCCAPCGMELGSYRALREGRLSQEEASILLPSRKTLASVWVYLESQQEIRETPICLCRKIVRRWEQPMTLAQLLTCLDIFRDVGLIQTERSRNTIVIRLTPGSGKADLGQSQTMRLLLHVKES